MNQSKQGLDMKESCNRRTKRRAKRKGKQRETKEAVEQESGPEGSQVSVNQICKERIHSVWDFLI